MVARRFRPSSRRSIGVRRLLTGAVGLASAFGSRRISGRRRSGRRGTRSHAIRSLIMQQDKRSHTLVTAGAAMETNVWRIDLLMATLGQGDLATQRESNRIFVKSIELEVIILGQGTDTTPRRTKVFLVSQRYVPTLSPAVGDLVNNDDVNSLRISSQNALKGRLTVHGSWDFLLQPGAITNLTDGHGSKKIIRFRKTFKIPHEVRFTGTGTATQGKGAFALMHCTELGAVLPTIRHNVRFIFVA